MVRQAGSSDTNSNYSLAFEIQEDERKVFNDLVHELPDVEAAFLNIVKEVDLAIPAEVKHDLANMPTMKCKTGGEPKTRQWS